MAYIAVNVAYGQQPAKTTTATTADHEFVQKAAAAGRMEVEQGKAAAAKASNAQVRTFGNTLVKEHSAANQQLMVIAKRKNITTADQPIDTRANEMSGGSAPTTTSATKSSETRDRQAEG